MPLEDIRHGRRSDNRDVVGGENHRLRVIGIFKYFAHSQKQIPSDAFVGADPKTVPHQLWYEWERELSREFLRLAKVKNLVEEVSKSIGVSPRDYAIKTHNSSFSGVTWQSKIETLRENLRKHRCDAMVS